MVAKNKRIKTHLLSHTQSMVTGYDTILNAIDAWLVQDDITVIGIEIMAEAVYNVGLDSGLLECQVEVSRNGKMFEDGALLQVIGYVYCRECTVGAGVNQCAVGEPLLVDRVMFPSGVGVDIDNGETIYLNLHGVNQMANTHQAIAQATIYYTER